MLPWTIDLGRFYRSHHGFAEAFRVKHGVDVSAIVVALAAMSVRLQVTWGESEGMALLRHLQRGYDGPCLRADVERELRQELPRAARMCGVSVEEAEAQLGEALDFLSLSAGRRDDIDLLLWGPHSVLLPALSGRVFVDLVWIGEILFNLFYDVKPEDHNFKGDLLEQAVRNGESYLTAKGCRAHDGSSKQFDASFLEDGTLVVVECKAIARSLGVDRGQTEAIDYRTGKFLKALNEVDEKVAWLLAHPRGSNYSLEGVRRVISVVCSAFVEFIPTRDTRWWLTESVPRVLSPAELAQAHESGLFRSPDIWNSQTIDLRASHRS